MRPLLPLLLLLVFGCTSECPYDFDPVCGIDNVTYSNSCVASINGIGVSHEGICAKEPTCTDSDGGRDIFRQGTAGDKSDRCEDEIIIEYYCENGARKFSEFYCPRGYECSGGECSRISCDDSDGGQIITERGETSTLGRIEKDFCIDSNTVREFYCSLGEIKSEERSCGSGEQCISGECVNLPCSDSDLGKEAEVRGSVMQGGSEHVDRCSGNFGVIEYFCSGDQADSVEIECAEGHECIDGACIEAVCTDSDSGHDYSEKGTVRYLGKTNQDSCYSDITVLEYYCSGNSIAYERISCVPGEYCSDGRCIESVCTKDVENLSIRELDEIEEYDSNVLLEDGDLIELDDGTIIDFDLNVYEDFGEYLDSDELCDFSDCNLSVAVLEDHPDRIILQAGDFSVLQDFESNISKTTFSGSNCMDDETEYIAFESRFYPYLNDTMEGEKIRIFDKTAKIMEIGNSFVFEFDGEEFELDDSMDFLNLTMDIDLSDGRLRMIRIS